MLNYSRMYFLPSTIAAAFGKRKEKGNIPLDWVGKCFYCSWIHLWHLIPWATSNWKLNTNSLRMGFLRTTVAPAMATMASSNKTEYIFNLGKLKSLTHFHINFFSGTGDIPKEVKTFEMRITLHFSYCCVLALSLSLISLHRIYMQHFLVERHRMAAWKCIQMELQKPRTCEMELIEIDDNGNRVKATWHNPKSPPNNKAPHRKM